MVHIPHSHIHDKELQIVRSFTCLLVYLFIYHLCNHKPNENKIPENRNKFKGRLSIPTRYSTTRYRSETLKQTTRLQVGLLFKQLADPNRDPCPISWALSKTSPKSESTCIKEFIVDKRGYSSGISTRWRVNPRALTRLPRLNPLMHADSWGLNNRYNPGWANSSVTLGDKLWDLKEGILFYKDLFSVLLIWFSWGEDVIREKSCDNYVNMRDSLADPCRSYRRAMLLACSPS